jgi:transcriptional regulator with XRE-family HTH domain
MPLRAEFQGLKGERRGKQPPPHVPIKALRKVTGITLDRLADEIGRVTGEVAPSRGTLSAIESGARGASQELLDAIEQVYGLDPGTITTTYRPRTWTGK